MAKKTAPYTPIDTKIYKSTEMSYLYLLRILYKMASGCSFYISFIILIYNLSDLINIRILATTNPLMDDKINNNNNNNNKKIKLKHKLGKKYIKSKQFMCVGTILKQSVFKKMCDTQLTLHHNTINSVYLHQRKVRFDCLEVYYHSNFPNQLVNGLDLRTGCKIVVIHYT